MILATLRVNISRDKKDSAMEILKSITGLLHLEPGAVGWRIYGDLDNRQAITLLQEWDSQADLDNYIRSKEYKKILALMDMSNRQPKVHFYDVNRISGLEFVESLRS
jgi:quinol monooxygenase YgiN